MKLLVFGIGTVLAATLVLGVGWKTTDFVGPRAFSAVGVACSADGKTVYPADLNQLWKSEDGGKTWSRITPQ